MDVQNAPRYLEFCYHSKRYRRPAVLISDAPLFWLLAVLIAGLLAWIFLLGITPTRSSWQEPDAECSTDQECAEKFPDDPDAGAPVPMNFEA